MLIRSPVLSPMLSIGMPPFSSSVSSRFAIGVWSSYPQVAPTLQLPARASGHQIRQGEMIMQIAVAHVAAEQNDRIVQQVAVAIRRALQLPKEPREQRDVIVLNLRQLLDLLRQILMMRRSVVPIMHAHLRIRLVWLSSRATM